MFQRGQTGYKRNRDKLNKKTEKVSGRKLKHLRVTCDKKKRGKQVHNMDRRKKEEARGRNETILKGNKEERKKIMSAISRGPI